MRCSIRDEWLRIEVLTLPEGRTVVVDQKLFQVRMPLGARTLRSAKLRRGGRKRGRALNVLTKMPSYPCKPEFPCPEILASTHTLVYACIGG